MALGCVLSQPVMKRKNEKGKRKKGTIENFFPFSFFLFPCTTTNAATISPRSATTLISNNDPSIIASYLSMWTHVISIGVSICGRCGEMSTVAGTSVNDNAITSTPAASISGQLSGQSTLAADCIGVAPSTADKP